MICSVEITIRVSGQNVTFRLTGTEDSISEELIRLSDSLREKVFYVKGVA